jgi:zinc transporter, ZIP family
VTDLDPILAVLLYSSLAAGAAALGVLPEALLGRLSRPAFGWANAAAAGLMLGVAYALLTQTNVVNVFQGAAGAVLGLGLVRATHAMVSPDEPDLNDLDSTDPSYGYQLFLLNVLHGAHEGVAIGAAMSVSLPFGISMALALGVHNIPEAMVFTSVVRSRGLGLAQATALAVAGNLNQVLVSVVVFAVIAAAPVLLPWAIGFAMGALTYLVLAELLPESYQQAGHTSIAVVTLVAMGVVVVLGSAP